MSVNGMHHTAISTPNIERLMNFYKENFNCKDIDSRSQWEKGTNEIDQVLSNSFNHFTYSLNFSKKSIMV